MIDRYKDEETIFNAAIQLKSRDERDAYLAEACGGDKKLRADVEALLKAHHESCSLLDEPIFDPDVTLDDSPPTEGPSTVIGRYKLLEKIGEGGMASVYMAEQEKPLRRRVALKIIKLGMDTKQVIARFEAERQALAMMNHPNIARVLDAGATETGRLYFVMELVKGVCITEYCDKNKLTTKERLDLFISVCNAVQHAHQKGIIHRDIKPSNVMVTLHDGTPVPKIIDFGIAKATSQKLTEKTLFTRYAQMIGTPAYMSPEQAEFSELDIDTRTDIYSLGVLLYELLTGATPFSEEELREAGYIEMQRIICEEEPDKPSTRLSTLGELLTDIAEHRRTNPDLLAKLVSGDLDWIVMKSLEKDRTRRYDTATELSADVERHLNSEPVLAAAPSVSYRLHKFVRRNRALVTSVAVVLIVLVAGIVASTIFAVGQARARAEAERQRNSTMLARTAEAQQRQRAEANFQKARDAVDEMTRVAERKLTDIPGTKQVRRELLQKAQVFYAGFVEENRDDPAVSKEIALAYKRVGIIHIDLGNFFQASEALGEAIGLLEMLVAELPSAPEYRVELADCWSSYARTFIWTHRRQELVRGRRKVLELLEELVADFPTVLVYQKGLAVAHTDLGNALKMTSRLKEAETHFRQSLAVWEKLRADFPEMPEDLDGLTHSHHWLGALLLSTGQLAEAEEQLRQALSLREQLLADDPNFPVHRGHFASIKSYLANLLVKQGKGEEAEKEYREAIVIREKLRAEFPGDVEHRRRLGWLLYGLGTVLMDRGLLQEAGDTVRQGIAYFEKLAADFPEIVGFQWDFGWCVHGLGKMLSRSGQLEEAVRAYREAIESREKLVTDFPEVPEYREELANTYFDLGDVLKEMGRLDEAEGAYKRAEEIRKEVEK